MVTDNMTTMQVAMTMLPKLNSTSLLPLFEKCGGIDGFFRESEKSLSFLCGEYRLSPGTYDRKSALAEAEKEQENMDRHDIRILTFEDSRYPFLLRQCPDTPLSFFYRGEIQAGEATYLGVVGTRKASEHCKARVGSILNELKEMGHRPVIVSGLAYGIDAAGHRASLSCLFKTYAVLGHGLHMIYPASHKNLAEQIVAQGGALISEFPCSARILPVNFLQRNRIIAGLCHAVLIAESAEKGGAMATARIAQSYDREILAIPGRPEDKMSAGCNLLIKENVAALTENGTDVAKALHLDYRKKEPVQTSLNFIETADEGAIILQILSVQGGMNIDELNIRSGIPMKELSALLLQFELEGKVISLPGKNYILS